MDKQKNSTGKADFSRINKLLEKDDHLIHKRKLTLGQRASDKLTRFCGSWIFILVLFIFISSWMILNITAYLGKWDPWPFIILNLVLSCLSTVQAPIILMSQNREEERSKIKMERDYLINRKAEKEIENVQKDLNEIKKLIKNLKK